MKPLGFEMCTQLAAIPFLWGHCLDSHAGLHVENRQRGRQFVFFGHNHLSDPDGPGQPERAAAINQHRYKEARRKCLLL